MLIRYINNIPGCPALRENKTPVFNWENVADSPVLTRSANGSLRQDFTLSLCGRRGILTIVSQIKAGGSLTFSYFTLPAWAWITTFREISIFVTARNDIQTPIIVRDKITSFPTSFLKFPRLSEKFPHNSQLFL